MRSKGKTPQPPDRSDDREIEAEFEKAMAGVTRLPADPRGRVSKAPSAPVVRPHQLPAGSGAVGPPPDNFVAAGVDGREIRRLKRGDYAPRGELDLHGVTASQARAMVKRFIENGRHARARCLCIVHGRGHHSASGRSVLRDTVRECLMTMDSVLAYAVAPASAGGAGAVYVLLRTR